VPGIAQYHLQGAAERHPQLVGHIVPIEVVAVCLVVVDFSEAAVAGETQEFLLAVHMPHHLGTGPQARRREEAHGLGRGQLAQEIPDRLVGRRGNPPPAAVVAEDYGRLHQRQSQLLADAKSGVVGGGEDECAVVHREPVHPLADAASVRPLLGLEQQGGDVSLLELIGGAEPGEAPAHDDNPPGAH